MLGSAQRAMQHARRRSKASEAASAAAASAASDQTLTMPCQDAVASWSGLRGLRARLVRQGLGLMTEMDGWSWKDRAQRQDCVQSQHLMVASEQTVRM